MFSLIQVSLKVYKDYVESIGITLTVVAVILYCVNQAFAVLGNVLLSLWSENKEGSVPSVRDNYLIVYAGFGILQS